MIDDEKTYAEKGYRSVDLSKGSHKLVWAVCEGENCGIEGGRGRWVEFKQYRDLCYECSMKIHSISKGDKRTEKIEYIDDDKTYAEKGYRSTELTPQSSRLVWRVCSECGEGTWVNFFCCTELCKKCAVKKRDVPKEEDRVEKLPWVDDEITYAEKGYRSTDLKPHSTKWVWAICIECGRGRWVMFFACHDRCKRCANQGENNPSWKGGISHGEYCKFFSEPLKDAIRNYFNNTCFECNKNTEENKNKNMSVHHINYQKSCGCDNTRFCVYVPLCVSCHSKTNGNRWFWYTRFMTKLAVRNPNYYAYHIPVVYYDEPSYNYSYVFEKRRKNK